MFGPDDLCALDGVGLAWLSRDERMRARRIADPRRACRFVRMRTALRLTLGRLLAEPPAALLFDVLPGGKPQLRGAPRAEFSLSHCGDHLALAVAQRAPLGVDLERIGSRPRDELAWRLFGAEAGARLARWPPDVRCRAFAWGWSEREAYLKALGLGIGDGWTLACGRLAGLPLQLQPPGGHTVPADVDGWRLHHLPVWPGFACVLCAPAGVGRVDIRRPADGVKARAGP